MLSTVLDRPTPATELTLTPVTVRPDLPAAADPNCTYCGHSKGMHMSFGGCSYRDPSTGDCPCMNKRSDIR